MSDRVALKRTATAGRLAIAGLTAALLGGCSSDALRMESFSSPLAGFSNPFSGMMGGDKTGSIETPVPRAASRAAASAFTPPPTPSAASMARYQQPVGGPVTGWSAAGGSSVVMASGESLTTLSQRYGVPEQAILKANGFNSASQLSPGTRLTIPVYNAGSATAATSRGAAIAPAKFAAPAASRASVAADETRAAQARLDEERARLAAARKEAAQAKAELEAEKRKAAAETRRAQSASLAAQTRDAKAEKAQAEAAQMKLRQERLARLKAEEEASHKKVAAARAEVKKQSRVEASARDAEAKERKRADAEKTTAKSASRKTADVKAEKPEKGRQEAQAKTELEAAKARKLADAKAEKEAKAAEAKARAEQKAADAKAKAEQETSRVARSEPKPEAAKPEPTTTASVKPEATGAGAGNPEFRWPARGRVIQGFRSNGNDGINIALPEGTAVKAAESGVVAYAGSELKNLGNLVLIRHPNGYVSAYAHNGDLDVKRGDTVKRGQTIARSGQSGAVQSPQLHFELRKGSTPVDPQQYLAGL